jgi:ATP-dependent Clp protease ATP-binding subunit ClpA
MQLANQEALRLNHEYVGTEHLLLGIYREGGGVAVNVLKNLGIDLRKVRFEVEKIVTPGPGQVTPGIRLPHTPRVKMIFEYAVKESSDLGHRHVGTEHLLLGMLRVEDGVAANVLVGLGVTIEKVRDGIKSLLGEPTGESHQTNWASLSETASQLDKLARVKWPDSSVVLAAKISAAAAIVSTFADRPAPLDSPLHQLWRDSVAFLAGQFAGDEGKPTATVGGDDDA